MFDADGYHVLAHVHVITDEINIQIELVRYEVDEVTCNLGYVFVIHILLIIGTWEGNLAVSATKPRSKRAVGHDTASCYLRTLLTP